MIPITVDGYPSNPLCGGSFRWLYVALKSVTLPPERIRVVRVTRRTLGSGEVYTLPAERIERQPELSQPGIKD